MPAALKAWWRRAVMAVLGLGTALTLAPGALADPAEPVLPPALTADTVPVAAAPAVTPPDGVPHLPSPDSLPPGTTQEAPEHRNFGYLRDIWQAVRNQDVSMSQALLLIAQRPMDSPTAGMSPHPIVADAATAGPAPTP